MNQIIKVIVGSIVFISIGIGIGSIFMFPKFMVLFGEDAYRDERTPSLIKLFFEPGKGEYIWGVYLFIALTIVGITFYRAISRADRAEGEDK